MIYFSYLSANYTRAIKFVRNNNIDYYDYSWIWDENNIVIGIQLRNSEDALMFKLQVGL